MNNIISVNELTIDNQEIISELYKQLDHPEYSTYNEIYIDNLILLAQGYKGYLIMSIANELLFRYVHWLEKEEQSYFKRFKNGLSLLVNTLICEVNKHITLCTKLKIKNNYDISQNLIVLSMDSNKIYQKINNIRTNLEYYDTKNFTPIQINDYIYNNLISTSCCLLNNKINDEVINNNLENSIDYDPFDDELEPITIDD